MKKVKSTFSYQVGGSLGSEAPSYVTRQADSEFYQALKAGQFCYVLNSRQMGKSSLRVQMMQRLQAEETICVFIDLTGMGKQDSSEKWYAGIVQSLVSGCQLTKQIQWRSWWRERRDLFSPVQRLSLFIDEVLLVEIKQNIIIFVDEIDRVLSQSFSLDDFFALIRYFSEQRNTKPDYQRLTWVLLGVTTPRDLIRDKTKTPFNIGKAIELQGFQLHEVDPLIEGFKEKVHHPQAMMKEILAWTGGQPFLTQKLCKLLLQELERTNPASLISFSYAKFVESVVISRLIENWEATDEPEHLRTIRDRIIKNEQRVCRLLGIYQQILEQGEISVNNSDEERELRLSGLIVERQGKLTAYNRIYQAVFNQTWLEQKLAELRPYAEKITTWFASGCWDKSSLLRGQELQNALTWALGKSLSDTDYQYLVASQDLAKRQVENSLKAAEQASELLASARKKAKQEVLKQQMNWKWIPTMALGIIVPMLLLRFCGLLQSLEWAMLDQFFRWRPREAKDTNIVIVTIDEPTLAQVGQWPIPDRILTQAITKIKAQQPRTIGLNLYRDLPIEPGHRDLVNLFQSSLNLFGIEKVVGELIAPPPVLSERQQVGFADQILDGDGKVRRALLAVGLSDQNQDVNYSLAVKLALHYLEAEGITLKESEKGSGSVLLGKANFERLEDNDGGYVRVPMGGYQVLLNFRGNQDNFSTFSLKQVLDEQIPLNSFRDRLVLIGTTAESIKDFFYTPYSNGFFRSPQLMPGVVLNANIASQIISAALYGRSLLRTWKEPFEWLFIITWAGVGAFVSWQFKFTTAIALSLLLTSSLLLGGCYLAFLMGWWLPIVPSLLSLLGAAVALSVVTNRKRDRLLFRRTLTLVLDICQDYPSSGYIALEYLKQSETKENQSLIEEWLNN